MRIKYHFFGKNCIIDRQLQNRSNLELALSEQKIYGSHNLFVNQIHSNEVVVIDAEKKIYGNQGLPKADALVTNLPNVVIGVITADCAPILFFDEKKKIIAAAHAGWRGAKSGVIRATIAEMRKIGAENIQAVIGPMIRQESYQVSPEFFDDFIAEDSANKIFFAADVSADKYQFDLPAYVVEKLHQAGVEKVTDLQIDTYKNDRDFFSFRRSTHLEENDCGRNVSVIVIGE